MLETRFSPDRKYRYVLARRVGFSDRAICFLMLNPSTADESVDDNTISRVIDYANRWGFGWAYVVNLSPFRATDPKDMKAAGPEPDDVWAENVRSILEVAQASEQVIVAYGADGKIENRASRVLADLQASGIAPDCFGLTKAGYPLHPLYLKKSLEPQPFQWSSQ